MVSVVADTNIYVSGLVFGGGPERFIRIAEAGGFQLYISDAILAEMVTVLGGEKIHWPEEKIVKARRQIARIAQHVQPTETLHVITADPSDNRILECAVAAKADYIISGDKHLLTLKEYGSIRILKLAEFMETVYGNS